MKILMLSNHYLPHTSGVGTSITRTVRNLEALGHEVRLVVPAFPGYREKNANIYRVPAYPFPPPLIPLPYPIKKFVAKIVADFKPNILHAHQPFLLGRTALTIAQKNNIPIVFTYHAMYEQYLHYIPLVPTKILRSSVVRHVMKFANQVSAVVAPSESVAQVLRARNLATPIHVIPTGINPALFVPSSKTRQATRRKWRVPGKTVVIISFARLANEKNFTLLLEALACVMQKNIKPNVSLVLGGDGPARVSLEKLAVKLGIRDNVNFTGDIPHQDVPAFLSGADIFAYPSLSETQGLVTLEALAAGLPAVVVDAPGNRDIVRDGVCGLLSQPNAADFAAKLLTLINNPRQLSHLAARAIPRATEFDEKKMVKKMEKLYFSLLGRFGNKKRHGA